MKTTIEIADDLFERAQRVARQEKTTFRSLTEQGLRLVLSSRLVKTSQWEWKPVVVRKGGMIKGFGRSSWDRIRDEIYRDRGA